MSGFRPPGPHSIGRDRLPGQPLIPPLVCSNPILQDTRRPAAAARQFVDVGHDTPTTDDLPLDDFPGAGGRVDLLAHCLLDGLLTSHVIREDVSVHLVLADEVSVSFDGASLWNLHPDERSAALIRTVLAERERASGHQPVEPVPGLEMRRSLDAPDFRR
jgi:tRNA pseudouridine-54 N-methylase